MTGSGPLMTSDAAQPPSQAEYASIRDALMSTARGRWSGRTTAWSRGSSFARVERRKSSQAP